MAVSYRARESQFKQIIFIQYFGTNIPNIVSKYPTITDTNQVGTIKANVNQNYIQPSWKLKTVKLKVGGRATVYEGTKVKIRCPVKKFKR